MFNIIVVIITILFHSAILFHEPAPGPLTDLSICKVSHLGLEYKGTVQKTESKVRCQSWTSSQPHQIRDDLLDANFSDGSRKTAKNFCRNPNTDPLGPWCYSMNLDLQFETCALPLCQLSQCKLTGPGMEYAGDYDKGTSQRKCLKWNKDRKKVKDQAKYISIPKFDKKLFPEADLSDAKKFCRNPSGDLGGPWCFVENEDTNDIEKEYCDVPFCDDPVCLVFSKNSDTYMHYTDFNNTLANLSFGVKLWDSDSYLEASARIVLTLLPLPLTGSEIESAGIGIEIRIGNNFSTLSFGNVEKPELEATHGILKSTEFTKFSLSWHRGFITFGYEGKVKPIFLAEYQTKNNLMGFYMNQFNYYSVQGTNIVWSFPFCKDDFECDAHVTTGAEFQQFWPLREKASGYDLYIHVRAHHSASVQFVLAPTIDFPNVKLTLLGRNNYTRITLVEYKDGAERDLKQLQLENIINYWKWREISISFFANTMTVYIKKPLGLQMLAEVKDEIFRNVRWFSVSSENTVAHWSFYCKPPPPAKPKNAFLPECAINSQESNYKGTQDITSTGLPCLPWSAQKLLPQEIKFSNKDELMKSWNYCRNPVDPNQRTYCYTISMNPDKRIGKSFCNIRKCKSEQCRMAGTGNDYSGTLNRTRSNRTCNAWVTETFLDTNSSLKNSSIEFLLKKDYPELSTTPVSTEAQNPVWNDTLFPEGSSAKAENFCRNPSRNIAGTWCYTTDPNVPEDACNVRDCDKPEECTMIISTSLTDRKTFILPQWKEAGLHGGLRFAIKEWNPDFIDGLSILITPKLDVENLTLQIAADNNERVKLFKNNELLAQKTLPHLIGAGKWTDFWLQMRRGEILFGLEGVPSSLFEWISPNADDEFEPMFINFASIIGKPMGLSFKCDECHTQNVTADNTEVYYPVGLWKEEKPLFNNITLLIRGTGITVIKLMFLPEHPHFFWLKMDGIKGTISFDRVEGSKPSVQLKMQHVKGVISEHSWTKYLIIFNESRIYVEQNNVTVLTYISPKPLLIYWFSVAPQIGWVTWVANCKPLDLDGPPRDGGWSAWSPWTCTASCGGGEGFRTRTCSNPRPNIFGKLCQGSPTSNGKCNDFPCGDISPETMDKIKNHLQRESFNYIVEAGYSKLIKNNKDVLKLIAKESPKAYYEWTLNGIFIKPEPSRVIFQKENIEVRNIRQTDSGVYVCILYRVNKKRVILRVITISVISKTFDIDTRATRSLTIPCNSVILGYVYTDLSLTILLNDQVYVDYGTTTLSAVNTYQIDTLNMSHSGNWTCVVEQKDLRFKWTTNFMKINVKKAPNLFTNLMEDKLTKPIFGWMKNETQVLVALIFIVVVVVMLVIIFLILYYKFCTLKTSRYNVNRRKE
uniref:Uncharacterized protein LOC114336079 isoform X1 n=2 Tax=Diabrotica virgifera virgifera TaxID=50390 RepID=A0A6P7G073_DIAVI